jgi:hypothetical protein
MAKPLSWCKVGPRHRDGVSAAHQSIMVFQLNVCGDNCPLQGTAQLVSTDVPVVLSMGY